ncbi:hypothetical protein AB0K89_25785, partial [Streptomyces cinnamoneus]|uniref:hypothetical protein n=1 Tax=Streptomyces cinnamoneus TaxID=53446 RepID=UPI00343D0F22
MTIWGRTGVLQPAVRAVLAVLASVLLVLSGAVAEGMESISVREEIPASAPLADGSSDECTACTAEQRVPRPGRVGRPAGRRACPQIPAWYYTHTWILTGLAIVALLRARDL